MNISPKSLISRIGPIRLIVPVLTEKRFFGCDTKLSKITVAVVNHKNPKERRDPAAILFNGRRGDVNTPDCCDCSLCLLHNIRYDKKLQGFESCVNGKAGVHS